MKQVENPATSLYKVVHCGILLDCMAVLGKVTGQWVGMEEEFIWGSPAHRKTQRSTEAWAKSSLSTSRAPVAQSTSQHSPGSESPVFLGKCS